MKLRVKLSDGKWIAQGARVYGPYERLQDVWRCLRAVLAHDIRTGR